MVHNFMEVLDIMIILIKTVLKKFSKRIGISSVSGKTICLLLLSTVFASAMTSCTFEKTRNCDILVKYQVPFAEADSRWNDVILVEKDEYGRELYRYKSEGSYTNVFSDFADTSDAYSCVNVYLIIQKTDKNYVYCYDNQCYIYVPSFESDNNDAVEILKEENDWNEPLYDALLSALPKDLTSNGMSDFKLVLIEEQILSALERYSGCEVNDYYLDSVHTADGKPIFVLREVKQWLTKETENVFGKSYVFFASDDYEDVMCQELSSEISNWPQEISAFLELSEENDQ